MTDGLQIGAELKRISVDKALTFVTVKVTCGDREVDINIRLADLIKSELDDCIKGEEMIRETMLPLFEGKNEDVTNFLEERLMHSVTRKTILNRMHQNLVATAKTPPAAAH